MASDSKIHITKIISTPTKIIKYRLKGSTLVVTIVETGKTCLVFSLHKWTFDSGAMDHMTSNPHIFIGFRSYNAPSFVTTANGSTYNVKGSETVKPAPIFTIWLEKKKKKTVLKELAFEMWRRQEKNGISLLASVSRENSKSTYHYSATSPVII